MGGLGGRALFLPRRSAPRAVFERACLTHRRAARRVHNLFNNNYQDHGQRNALQLTKMLSQTGNLPHPAKFTQAGAKCSFI